VSEATAPAAASNTSAAPAGAVLSLKRVADVGYAPMTRMATRIAELDRVLGGGIVPGSIILLGGEPGIGKSTLSLQIACAIPGTLYISGEESAEQVRLRAERMDMLNAAMRIAHTDSTDAIIATIHAERPPLVIVDSIQTIAASDVAGDMGSMAQVRASAAKLLAAAKTLNTAIAIVGHITKDGAIAGPKTLEHIVDTVLSFEGDARSGVRMLRAVKNRFGSTDEIGMFDMDETGLKELPNPSGVLLESRGAPMSGSVLACLMEGSRPFLVEIQALVTKTAFGYPVRKASGFDANRLHLLIAILQKRTGINLSQYDVHLNVAGGIQAREPAADIAVCLALASAFKDKTLGNDLAAFGEVGIGGEVKGVQFPDKRLAHCAELGLARAIVPKIARRIAVPKNIKTIEVANIQELIAQT
jgi:DNA repair protein RadA/Sms